MSTSEAPTVAETVSPVPGTTADDGSPSVDTIDAAGFAAVVLTACVSAFTVVVYRESPFSIREAALGLALVLAYVAAGTFGYRWCRRRNRVAVSVAYFTVQIGIAAALMATNRGGVLWLILLPLAGQSVVLLPRWRWTAVCVALVACAVLPVGLAAGPAGAVAFGSVFVTVMVFALAFAHVAVAERAARERVEQLAAALEQTNAALVESARASEDLALAHERNRLAREIHDGLGHYLTVLVVQLAAARSDLPPESPHQDTLGKLAEVSRAALADVRRSVATLRPESLNGPSLPEAARTLVAESRDAGLAAELIVAGTPRALGPNIELALFRIAQEALTNVRRHARATAATILLDYLDEGTVRLAVRDNGIGASRADEGFGLVGIRERAELLGGTCTVQTAAGHGFAVEVELPA